MQKKFKDWIDYSKRLGKIIISGNEGTGKTLLLTRIAIGKMLCWRDYIYKSFEQIDEYNRMGYNFSKDFEHLCFANYDINCAGTDVPSMRSYVSNPYESGLFSTNYDTIPYPPYSLLCWTESKNYLDAYMYDKFQQEFIEWFRTGRQADIDMAVDSQCFGDIVTLFRKIANRFIYLYKECEHIYNADGERIGHKLFVREFSRWQDADKYEQTATMVNCEEYELIVDIDIFPCYDNKFCRFLHVHGRETQDYVIKHFPTIKTIEDVEILVKGYGLLPPDNFFKNSKKDKNKSKNKQIDDDFDDENNYEF